MPHKNWIILWLYIMLTLIAVMAQNDNCELDENYLIITSLSKSEFQNCINNFSGSDYPLKKIIIQHCFEWDSLTKADFNQFTFDIEEILIEHTPIQRLDDDTFESDRTLFLEKLEIINSSLQSIPALALHNLTNLRYLHFMHNKIRQILEKDFQKLPHSIKGLDLSNNGIGIIEDGSFDGFNFDYVNLQGTSFICNNHLKWLIDWVRKREEFLNLDETKCLLPSFLYGKLITEITDENITDFSPVTKSPTFVISITTPSSTSTSSSTTTGSLTITTTISIFNFTSTTSINITLSNVTSPSLPSFINETIETTTTYTDTTSDLNITSESTNFTATNDLNITSETIKTTTTYTDTTNDLNITSESTNFTATNDLNIASETIKTTTTYTDTTNDLNITNFTATNNLNIIGTPNENTIFYISLSIGIFILLLLIVGIVFYSCRLNKMKMNYPSNPTTNYHSSIKSNESSTNRNPRKISDISTSWVDNEQYVNHFPRVTHNRYLTTLSYQNPTNFSNKSKSLHSDYDYHNNWLLLQDKVPQISYENPFYPFYSVNNAISVPRVKRNSLYGYEEPEEDYI